jgi:hypothetical protein
MLEESKEIKEKMEYVNCNEILVCKTGNYKRQP